LLQAKDRLDHGAWLPWLKQYVGIPERTCQRYMRLAEHAPALLAKSATVADLTVRAAEAVVSKRIVPVNAYTGAARVTAMDNFLTAAAEARELGEAARRRLEPHIAKLSAAKREQLFAAAEDAARAWSALAADLMKSPRSARLREAAE
jgi:hypothetical protein